MDKFNLKVGKYYEVDYTLTTAICKNGIYVSNKEKLTLKNVMFHRSTACYYTFWATISRKFVRIKKDNVLDVKEL